MIGRKCSMALCITLLVIGIAFIVIGVIIEVVPEQIISSMLKQNLPLVPGSKMFEAWKNPGKLRVTMKFHFFDLKNHIEATEGKTPLEWGGKPVVEEKGPYVYRVIKEQTVIGYNKDKTELTFERGTKFEFDAEASTGSEDDIIHGINMPLLTCYGLLSKIDPKQQNYVKSALNGKSFKLVQSMSVREWLWGAESAILLLAMRYKSIMPAEFKGLLKSSKFGYMMSSNETSTYVIGTGYEDLKDVAQIKKYNNKTDLTWWGSCYSNRIQGTDGTIFHPGVNPKETLSVFNPDVCRSIYVTNTGEQMVNGIKTYLFSMPAAVFAAPDENPDNEGFCKPKPCLANGLIRVTNCHKYAPLVMSQPHLCDAAEKVQQTIEGMKPDPKIHRTQLYIEPNFGINVEVKKRLQYNGLLLPAKGIDLAVNLTENQIVPLFWIEEGFTGDEEFSAMLKSNLAMLAFFPNYGKAIFYILTAIGIISIIIAFTAVAYQADDNEMHLPPVRMSNVTKNNGSKHGSKLKRSFF